MNDNKRTSSQRRHQFLNAYFFPNETGYATKEWEGWVLVRQYNANIDEWEIAIFTKDSFKKYREFKEASSLFGNG